MAKPLTTVKRHERTEQEQQTESLQELSRSVAEHKEALEQTLLLVEELHASGALELVTALTRAREPLAKIAVEQASKPAVTQTIRHALNAADILGQLDPEKTKKVLASVVHGVERAGEALDRQERVSVFDLIKALKDPGVNRAVTALLHFLQGMGETL